MEPKNKESLGFKRLKFIGYCISQTPPKGADLDDLVIYAKFRLCEWRGYLMKDPVWDEYRDEEILIEYYATRFEKDEDFRNEFSAALGTIEGDYEDAVTWMEKEIQKNAAEVKKLKIEPKEEEEFEYTPPVVGGE